MTNNFNTTSKPGNLLINSFTKEKVVEQIDEYLSIKQKNKSDVIKEVRFHPQSVTSAPSFFLSLPTIPSPDKAIQSLVNLFFPNINQIATTTVKSLISETTIALESETITTDKIIIVENSTVKSTVNKKINEINKTKVTQIEENTVSTTKTHNITEIIGLTKTKLQNLNKTFETITTSIKENKNNQKLQKNNERRKKINLQEKLNKEKILLKKLTTPLSENFSTNLIIDLKSNIKNTDILLTTNQNKNESNVAINKTFLIDNTNFTNATFQSKMVKNKKPKLFFI